MKTSGLRPRIDKLGQRLSRNLLQSASHDVVAMAFLRAGFDAADFYELYLTHARTFAEHRNLLTHAVHSAKIDGLYLEFGVASGRTVTHIAQQTTSNVYGFDSFEGLPEAWYTGYERGAFARTNLPSVPENVELLKGWFSDTLPGFLERHDEPVAFLHVDCDLYSSASFVLRALADRIVSGTVILFDEFFNYPGWRRHEYKAWQEFVEASGTSFRYESFLRNGQAVCVIIE